MLKDDNRREMLEKVLKDHNYQKSALLEILHGAQEIYGFLDKELLTEISGLLNLPPSQVYGVATFYSFFNLRKPGEHIITACLGTACYVKGIEQIMTAIEEEFHLKRGGSTKDGKLSLFQTRCIGACAMAPNISIDDVIIGKATKEETIKHIKQILGEDKTETI
ncbi:MAG: NAD(P)H-dependent oxidoreductase subunit E [Nitrososphaerota archaeon]|nr:NAD(P)H-dependent oxidoreductase subunit E [Nitrososphaerota archaeon]